MKIKEIVAKKDIELKKDLKSLSDSLTKLKFEVSTKESDKSSDIKKIRRQIAQVRTILREREIQREEKDEKKS